MTIQSQCDLIHDVRWSINKEKWVCFNCGKEFTEDKGSVFQ